MAKGEHNFSGQNQKVEDLAQWFQINMESIREYKANVLDLIRSQGTVPQQFFGMTYKEVEEHFSHLFREVELSFCLNLIAAVEARFRMDYVVRATDKLKDALSREFRTIYKEKEEEVNLENIILENWKKYHPNFKNYISAYISALKYRHWLAHGRYWIPKLGRQYDVTNVYPICHDIVSKLPLCI